MESVKHIPLALICGLLGFLQLLQGCGQSLLSTIQLFLNQLDTPVQRSHLCLSLQDKHDKNNMRSEQIHYSNELQGPLRQREVILDKKQENEGGEKDHLEEPRRLGVKIGN